MNEARANSLKIEQISKIRRIAQLAVHTVR
jgi:hypothetical protein